MASPLFPVPVSTPPEEDVDANADSAFKTGNGNLALNPGGDNDAGALDARRAAMAVSGTKPSVVVVCLCPPLCLCSRSRSSSCCPKPKGEVGDPPGLGARDTEIATDVEDGEPGEARVLYGVPGSASTSASASPAVVVVVAEEAEAEAKASV